MAKIVNYTKEQIVALYRNLPELHKIYSKKGRFISRPAVIGETILTIVAGKLETIKTVSEDSVIIRNIILGGSAETYAIPLTTFTKRYKLLPAIYTIDGLEWTEAIPNGKTKAFQYLSDESISFMAPWGENMLMEKGDWLAGDPDDEMSEDIYRIEKDTFRDTYL